MSRSCYVHQDTRTPREISFCMASIQVPHVACRRNFRMARSCVFAWVAPACISDRGRALWPAGLGSLARCENVTIMLRPPRHTNPTRNFLLHGKYTSPPRLMQKDFSHGARVSLWACTATDILVHSADSGWRSADMTKLSVVMHVHKDTRAPREISFCMHGGVVPHHACDKRGRFGLLYLYSIGARARPPTL